MHRTVAELRRLSPTELDALFRRCPPGPVPRGSGDGTMLIGVGAVRRTLAALLRTTVWKGKVVESDGRALRNRVGPVGSLAVPAEVSVGRSWSDGGQSIVIDYSRTSWAARRIRDEVRLVDDGLYLGIVFWGRARIKNVWFTLRFPP